LRTTHRLAKAFQQLIEVGVTFTAGQRLSDFVVEERLHPLLGSTARLPVSHVLTLTNMFPIWVAVLSWPLLHELPAVLLLAVLSISFSYLISPLVMSRAVSLPPALVAVGVLAVVRLFGLAGLLVAVPIVVTVKLAVEELWVRPIEEQYAEQPDPQPAATATRSGNGSRTREAWRRLRN